MSMRQAVFLTSALLLFATSCGAPKIKLQWSSPAAFGLPTEVPVALIVETDGVKPTATSVLDTALDVTRGQVLNKWLAVEPVRQELTAALQKKGYRIVDGSQAQALIKVRPTGWSYALDSKKKDFRNGVGRLDVRLEIYDAKKLNEPPLYTRTYWARGAAANIGEPEALLRAARSFPAAFFRDLAPRRVSAEVELDDSDPIVKPGIELCRDNQFGAAYDFFHDTVERAPTSAPALYDYAVMAEIKGNYDQAEALLIRATQLAQKPLYYKALERVRGARNDAQAMNSP